MNDMKIYEQDEKKVVICLDELAAAMRADEDPDSSYEENPEYEQEWETLAGDLDEALNRYIAKAGTVSINGVNLFGVRRILVDAYGLRQDGDCSIGLYFYGSAESVDEMALFLVDAAQTNLHVTISNDGKLVCLDMVDKLGRRF